MQHKNVQSESTIKTATIRAVAIGLFCVAGICVITPYNNHYVHNTYLASNHLPIGPLFILIVLIVFSAGLRRLTPRLSLNSGELVVIWSMMSVTASIPSKAFVEYLLPALVGHQYFATPENEWSQLFHSYIPAWLAPKNAVAAKGFYESVADGSVPWSLWLKPLMVWTLFGLSLYGTMICLSTILRKQWIQNERIPFPLVQLPASLIGATSDSAQFPDFFRRRLMWIGFAVAGGLHLLNGLHFYFPVVPAIPTRFSLNPFLTEKPFSAMRPLPLHLHPSVIGITYLLAEQISLSLWVFYLFYKLQCFVFALFSLPTPSSPGEFGFTRSFASHQEMGAFLVVVCLIVWRARRHLLAIIAPVRNTDNQRTSADERGAVFGLFGLLLLQVVLSQLMGISLWVALSTALFSAVMWVIFTWQVSSAGVLIVHPTFRPMMMLRTIFGDPVIGPRNLTVNTFQARAFRTDLTQLTMPHVMNAFKLGDVGRVKNVPLLLAMIVSIVIALPISTYFFLKLAYKVGANTVGLSWVGRTGWRVLESRLVNPADMNPTDLGFIGLGATATLLVAFMYQRFLWWSLHPIGCTTGSSWGIQMFLLSIFLGWFFKYLTLKYGGLKTYSRAKPLFLGLILGEYVVGAMWIIVGLCVGRGYRILTA